ncbi:MAG: hypothetical protein ABI333_23425 [bacterium]
MTIRRLFVLFVPVALLLPSGCESFAPSGQDAAVDGAAFDAALDAAEADAGAQDGATGDTGVADAEVGGDASPDGGVVEPCGGACDATAYDSCTCGAADPCGWQANGICDDACRTLVPGGHFDDGADCDLDLDGMYDTLEYELALQFEPFLWLSPREEGWRDDRYPHFAVETLPGGGVSIFYALSYYQDYGDPDLGGLTSHLGDSEFVVVYLQGSGPYQLAGVFLSAHYGAITNGSVYADVTEIQLHQDATGMEHPIVYVSEWKHANYTDLQSCDNGALFTDHCEEFALERVGIAPGRNVGNAVTPLQDDVSHLGNHEFYWTDVRFCGWQVASVNNGDRGACPGTDSTYLDFMTLWLTDSL